MVERCHDENNQSYHNYGARGIEVCEEWREIPNEFIKYIENILGDKPSPAYSLDRIDNGKGYAPGNLRWATQKEQSRNTRRNVRLTVNGETHTIAGWTEIMGYSRSVIKNRRNRGWSDHDAVLAPLETRKKKRSDIKVIAAHGVSRTIYDWSEITGLTVHCIRNRLRRGKSPEEAIYKR